MTDRPATLEDLRRESDAIDDRIHDLLMRRTEIVEDVSAVKSRDDKGPPMRPAREVAILRRLLARHEGSLPPAVVVRIWREMVAALTRIQGNFSIAVSAPEKSVGYWDLARDQYGSGTRMTLHRLAAPVIRAVAEGSAAVGVLPLPLEDEPDPWWRMLITGGEHPPRIIARLPFIENPGGRFEHLGALAVACIEQEPTGDDVSLVAVEANAELSRASVRDAFAAAGLSATDSATWRDPESAGGRLHLIEIAEFVGPGDERLETVLRVLGSSAVGIIPLGGYAVPLALAEGRAS